MTKVINFSENTMPLNFYSPEQHFEVYKKQFEASELGGIYKAIPWQKIISLLCLKRNKKGPEAIFSPHAKVALMFLKHYTNLSDRKLLDRLNSDYQFQFFCNMFIDPLHPIENYKKISEARVEIAENVNIKEFQKLLAQSWAEHLDPKIVLTDATCYESYIRYPTDAKLLWESVSWVKPKLNGLYQLVKGAVPRSKFIDISKAYQIYSKKRRKTYKQTTKIKRRLIHLLKKLCEQLSDILETLGGLENWQDSYQKRYNTIKNILVQQTELLEGKEVKNRIVSIDKEYIRPIIRGKENKRVEFGAKANVFQVSGISFVEHLSFDAFNEGTHLKNTVETAHYLFERKLDIISADKIFANNKNRTYCTTEGITTNFVPKGRPAKDEKQRKQLRKELDKERSTRMEGAFGTHKNHYSLQKVKARTKKTEILWILFGIHTSNAKLIASKIKQKELEEEEKKKQAA
ncbi:MAG: transposase [Bacteroidales bacterium]|nr:transposase [Bacteroidales bacterium]